MRTIPRLTTVALLPLTADVRGYPTYILIDGDGVVRWRVSGYGSETDGMVESEIKKTLKKKS